MSNAHNEPPKVMGSPSEQEDQDRIEVAFRDGVVEQYGSASFPDVQESDPLRYAQSKRPQAVKEAKDLRELDIALGLLPETCEDDLALSDREKRQRSNRASYQNGVIANKAFQDCLRDLYVGYDVRMASLKLKKFRLKYENRNLDKKLAITDHEVSSEDLHPGLGKLEQPELTRNSAQCSEETRSCLAVQDLQTSYHDALPPQQQQESSQPSLRGNDESGVPGGTMDHQRRVEESVDRSNGNHLAVFDSADQPAYRPYQRIFPPSEAGHKRTHKTQSDTSRACAGADQKTVPRMGNPNISRAGAKLPRGRHSKIPKERQSRISKPHQARVPKTCQSNLPGETQTNAPQDPRAIIPQGSQTNTSRATQGVLQRPTQANIPRTAQGKIPRATLARFSQATQAMDAARSGSPATHDIPLPGGQIMPGQALHGGIDQPSIESYETSLPSSVSRPVDAAQSDVPLVARFVSPTADQFWTGDQAVHAGLDQPNSHANQTALLASFSGDDEYNSGVNEPITLAFHEDQLLRTHTAINQKSNVGNGQMVHDAEIPQHGYAPELVHQYPGVDETDQVQIRAPTPTGVNYEAIYPIQQIQPIQRIQPMQPVQPIQQIQQIQQIQPIQPIQPIQQIQQIQPIQPIQSIRPIHPIQPIHPFQSVQSVQLVEPVQPIEIAPAYPDDYSWDLIPDYQEEEQR